MPSEWVALISESGFVEDGYKYAIGPFQTKAEAIVAGEVAEAHEHATGNIGSFFATIPQWRPVHYV